MKDSSLKKLFSFQIVFAEKQRREVLRNELIDMTGAKVINDRNEKTHGQVGFVLCNNTLASGHLVTDCDINISSQKMVKNIVSLSLMQMQRMGVIR